MKADTTKKETLRAVVHEDEVSFTVNNTLRDNESPRGIKVQLFKETYP